MLKHPKWASKWFNDSYQQYLSQISQTLDTSKINTAIDMFINYKKIKPPKKIIHNVALVKLNGGLGTSMGCTGPKSLINCTESGKNFLDIIIQHYESTPIAKQLILLNSFNTTKQTNDFISKNHPKLKWKEIIQHPFKKIDLSTNKPFPNDDNEYLNPPGHGSIYYDLFYSGTLDECLEDGIEYLFISNADNLAATVDPRILNYMTTNKIEFLIELTKKTLNDRKGGTIINYNDNLTLWECAQVSNNQLSLFESQPVFNTNNIWVHIPTLIQKINNNQLKLDLILNKKTKNNISFIQFEYAMGSAIQSFAKNQAIIVPRTRFFPIKKTSDLFLLLSNYSFIDDNGHLNWDHNKSIHCQLEAPFDKVDSFLKRFKIFPCVQSLEHLEISGDISFDHPIELIGTVKLHVPKEKSFKLPNKTQIINEALSNGKLVPIPN